MSIQDFSRSKALNNIPNKKLEEILSSLNEINNTQSSDALLNRAGDAMIKKIAFNKFAESNIPIEYWYLKMEKDFSGDPRLLAKYNEYTLDLKKSYIDGESICFAGKHGIGKSMVSCCILKKACLKGYSCLYTDLSNIVNVLTQGPYEERYDAKRELIMVDFLVIDEFDPRFMGSENAADLYARTLEGVFRNRAQNKLPTLMCTNSPNVIGSFTGALKQSIDSLFSGYMKTFVVIGDDFRKKE